MIKHIEAERVSVDAGSASASVQAKFAEEQLKRRVRRHSPDRLLRQKLFLPGDITVSAERHNGRLVVRVESPIEDR